MYTPIPPACCGLLTGAYDLACGLGGFGVKFRDRIIEDMGLPERGDLLDAGCGTGTLALRIKKRFPGIKVTGLDPSAAALAIAGRKSLAQGLSVDWVPGLGEAMPFPGASFDIVVTTLALHHVPVEMKGPLLREAFRVLRPGGRLLLADFSEGGSLAASVVFFWMMLLEHISGQLGRLPGLMADAGFSRVALRRRYHFGVCSYEGVKPPATGSII